MLVLLFTNPVFAYETGSMSCAQIGEFAAATVHGKKNGLTYRKAIANLNKTVPATYYIEKRNLKQIINAIYKEDWGKHLSEDGAYSSFQADCQVQK